MLLVWWTLHDVDLREVWSRIRAVRPLPFTGAVLLATITFPLRTVRWRYLLRTEGTALPFVPLWHATAIGFMANNLLPARAGEVARAFVASRLTEAPFATAVGSIAVERVLDGLMLVSLLTLAIALGGFAPEVTVAGATVAPASVARFAAVSFVGLLAALIVFVYVPQPFLRIVRWADRRLVPATWGRRLLEFLEALRSGLDVLRSPKRFVLALWWSAVVWGTMSVAFWLAFVAFGVDAPWSASLMLNSIVAFGVALPSTPGFFGPFEAATRVAFALYGLDETTAASYAVGYHIATFIPITLLGIWSLGRAGLHLGDLRDRERVVARRHEGTEPS